MAGRPDDWSRDPQWPPARCRRSSGCSQRRHLSPGSSPLTGRRSALCGSRQAALPARFEADPPEVNGVCRAGRPGGDPADLTGNAAPAAARAKVGRAGRTGVQRSRQSSRTEGSDDKAPIIGGKWRGKEKPQQPARHKCRKLQTD